MKILAKLPDSKHFYVHPSGMKPGRFLWEDRASPLLLIDAPVAQSTDQEFPMLISIKKGKTRGGVYYPQSIVLRCLEEMLPGQTYTPAVIERERWKGKLAYSLEPTLFFAAIAPNEVQILHGQIGNELPQLARAIAKVGGDVSKIQKVLEHFQKRLFLEYTPTQNWLMLSIFPNKNPSVEGL